MCFFPNNSIAKKTTTKQNFLFKPVNETIGYHVKQHSAYNPVSRHSVEVTDKASHIHEHNVVSTMLFIDGYACGCVHAFKKAR